MNENIPIDLEAMKKGEVFNPIAEIEIITSRKGSSELRIKKLLENPNVDSVAIMDPTGEYTVFNPIKELSKKLPIVDGNILVDEFGKYKETANMLGLEITEFKGKLAYKISDSKERDEN
ncbi:TPA: hypothetical protein U3L25_000229 [Streptococcus agalactiae]|nr:hypothetical protein [Streptococcus agalactiae]HEM9551155.1 hypothetical protein [Streptococcus agalactiae]HEM9553136.1 hypothetical protein [Streptococcus agalactiae]HEM9567064.1 hypothetical protein [Streptococcus agalactiae]HEM9606096.1 hypothetical protein [Streptococcus agalactiae]